MARFNNILETIGGTPLVRLNKLGPDHVNIYLKLEYFNPMASVKDRMAQAIIEQAEKTGALQPGQTVIEATSGNTGIGLAMVCAQKGYPLVVTMAESASVERRKLLRFLGARVVLTPAADKGTGMLHKADELAKEHGYFQPGQFENEVNAEVHSRTTAREILDDFDGENIDYWLSGFGTGGTLKGVAATLKQERPKVKIVAVEPDNAQLLGSSIRQKRDEKGEPNASHPNFQPHLMQGWSPDFISGLAERAVDAGLIDQIVAVDGNDALQMSRSLASEEGVFAGITSGATLAAALKIAEQAEVGSNIVCMIPDTGERYLSTPLFEHIQDDMNEEEVALSESTPLCRFTEQTKAAPLVSHIDDSDDLEADTELDQILKNDAVVMFALEWCEFSWAARKLFAALDIPYRSVDIDNRANQDSGMGKRLRKALGRKTGNPTIPKIFIDQQLIGGNTDLFTAYENGDLHKHLGKIGVNLPNRIIDVQEFLPGWIHSRKSA